MHIVLKYFYTTWYAVTGSSLPKTTFRAKINGGLG